MSSTSFDVVADADNKPLSSRTFAGATGDAVRSTPCWQEILAYAGDCIGTCLNIVVAVDNAAVVVGLVVGNIVGEILATS